MSMQSSILSVLRMWPNGQTKSEIFTAMYLASIGYPKLRNMSPLGGRDGGRDLESLDGEHYVACYFPMQEQMNFESIKSKFISDLEKAKRNRTSEFTFFTGQIIQNHQKENLKKFGGDIGIRIISGDEIAAHVCRIENGALRAELGFVDRTQASPDEVFSKNLFSRVNFESLIKAINESIPPNTFSGCFLNFFDDVESFRQTAQPSLLSPKLRWLYFSWEEALARLEEEIVDSPHYEYFNQTRSFHMRWLGDDSNGLPRAEFLRIADAKKSAHRKFADATISLARYIGEQYGLLVQR